MKDAARLESVIEILALHGAAKKPLDRVSHGYFKTRRYIGSKDRQAISAHVYGIMRHRASCDWWALERGLSPLLMEPINAARIRLLSYLWIHEKMKRETFGILFSGEQYAPEKLSDKECSIFEKLPELQAKSPWIEGEFPEWLYPFLKRRFGENLTAEMAAFLEQAPLDLRVNTLKATREDALKSLERAGLEVLPSSLSPWGLRSEERENITQTKAFQEGHVEVQDEGSQLIANLMDVLPGQSILDLCAGAGGKTLALAALLENKGRVVATDVAEWRLKRAKERMKRAGAFNVELRAITGFHDKWLKRQKERFDRVLIDAPCSGTGTWRRNPDQKWNITEKDIKELCVIQASLLEGAAPLVKRGGYLVYATCSLLLEENQDIAASFLETNPEFTLAPCGLDGASFLSLSPLQNGTDGFFAAKFVRVVE
ncbi:MAG: RsmB/NOP family class I SAM-dependent RNA methyltransferase [Alphaproteobacteria bacterium]|nr:RsmB/NOP family class I SAM-dependent RNA methyltransferase [Alphaproteobacteria bacterium]